jgi:hypothetical protein
MQATYQGAILGLTEDLTREGTATYTVAAIVLGTAGPLNFAAVGSLRLDHLPPLDPLTEELLRDLPALLRYQIDSVLDVRQPVDTDAGLRHVAAVLRNSLHVVKILPQRFDDITTQADLQALLARAVGECLGVEVTAPLSEMDVPGLRVPELLLWQLEDSRLRAHR